VHRWICRVCTEYGGRERGIREYITLHRYGAGVVPAVANWTGIGTLCLQYCVYIVLYIDLDRGDRHLSRCSL